MIKLLKLLLTPVPSTWVFKSLFKEQSKAKYFLCPEDLDMNRTSQCNKKKTKHIIHVAGLKNKQHFFPYSSERKNFFSAHN